MLTATFTSSEIISFCISITVSVERVRAAALWKCGQIGKSQTVYLLLVLLFGRMPTKN